MSSCRAAAHFGSSLCVSTCVCCEIIDSREKRTAVTYLTCCSAACLYPLASVRVRVCQEHFLAPCEILV